MNSLKVVAKRPNDYSEVDAEWLGHDRYRCPICRTGYFRVIFISRHAHRAEPEKCECGAVFRVELSKRDLH